mmetsp:Transcript_29494/g.76149  ORF Transcript_29494/g.76149 Transcript_29494/m.76149 type:complete len:259 (-) Transcript_29494:213-989(-)|eukprot:CAMPEP_0113883212 /NCGR_PEP_ID=MMETSP0780_2-20120614/9444_1 /TAXON_ID=652834 /ORGANISM="Palpitomonas bilix" /LENGTH=258 /DNA_ID=CAMNT_0000870431 /DNA_START=205 /DNA_END=981 /DNA_ORIENTATION=- /assembly_acc=CAM_ASM_000599
MKIVAISDTHNCTDKFEPPAGDVLLIGGDFTGRGRYGEVQHFLKFIDTIKHKYKHIVVTAGNHEVTFDEKSHSYKEECKELVLSCKDIVYLENTVCELEVGEGENKEKVKIFGSPYTLKFWGGFQITRAKERAFWDELIPDDVDIVITHGPPHRILDRVPMKGNVGDKNLMANVERIKPKLHMFGHIHEDHGAMVVGDTLFVNAAVCNVLYYPSNPTIVIDYPAMTYEYVGGEKGEGDESREGRNSEVKVSSSSDEGW